jgi:CheY-like chemotaxis protein
MESKNQLRILLAEDDQMVAKMLVRVLAMQGFDVHYAENGRQALDMLKTNVNFDVLLTDLNLPEVSGLELVKFAVGHHPGMRIVVLSGSPVPDDEPDLWKNVQVLQKPVAVPAIMAALRTDG